MKRIMLLLLIVLSMMCLGGCRIRIYSKEEKEKIINWINELDQIEEYKYAHAQIYNECLPDRYRHSYEFDITDEGTIRIDYLQLDDYKAYIYSDGKVVIEEYLMYRVEGTTNYETELLKETEVEMTKEEFLSTYEKKEYSKFNLNLEDTTYYKVQGFAMDGSWWIHNFVYDKDYIFNFKVFDKEVNLTNVVLKIETDYSSYDRDDIKRMRITGIEDGIEYYIEMTIDKEVEE